jgi:hypothetical protein
VVHVTSNSHCRDPVLVHGILCQPLTGPCSCAWYPLITTCGALFWCMIFPTATSGASILVHGILCQQLAEPLFWCMLSPTASVGALVWCLVSKRSPCFGECYPNSHCRGLVLVHGILCQPRGVPVLVHFISKCKCRGPCSGVCYLQQPLVEPLFWCMVSSVSH